MADQMAPADARAEALRRLDERQESAEREGHPTFQDEPSAYRAGQYQARIARAEATLAKIRDFVSEQASYIRAQYGRTGPAGYLGFANACEDVLAILDESHVCVTPKGQAPADVAALIEEAFNAHEGAPTWQDDPVARDAAIRWHMRGFHDALERASQPVTEERVEAMCEVMHDAYERAAAAEGWETQERSRKPWAEVPEANRRTMRVAVRAVLEAAREAGR